MSAGNPVGEAFLARPELLVTVEEAAERLAISRSFLYQLLRRGTVPSVTIGRARRVAITDLERFVDHLRQAADGEEEAIHLEGENEWLRRLSTSAKTST